MKAIERVEVTKDFTYTRANPLRLSVIENDWKVYKNSHQIVCSDKYGDKFEFDVDERGGFVFLTKTYAYYRKRTFQYLLDALKIDKVIRVKDPRTFELTLTVGILDLEKSFAIYADKDISITRTKNINTGKPHWTQQITVTFDSGNEWAIVYTNNSMYSYGTFYYWGASPHNSLEAIVGRGVLPHPVLTTY